MVYEFLEKLRRFSFGIFLMMAAAFIGLVYFVDVDRLMTKQKDGFIIDGSYIRISRKGKIKWEVWTDRIVVDMKDEVHRFKNVKKGFYYREGKPPFMFKAGRGEYNNAVEEVHLDKNIEFSSENGDYFKTEKVDWYGKPEKLTVPGPLKLIMDGNTYTAGEMESIGEDLRTLTLRKNVVVQAPDVENTGTEKTKNEIEESGVDKRYLKKLTLTAQMVEYEGEPKKYLKCFPIADQRMIFVPGEKTAPAPLLKVFLTGENFNIEAARIDMDFSNKLARATGSVLIFRKGEPEPDASLSKVARAVRKRDAMIETEEALYYWKDGFMQMPGPMHLFQEELEIDAGRAFIDSKKDSVYLSEGVLMHQGKSDWILKEKLISEDVSDKTREATKEETTITSETMEMNFETEDLAARGEVAVVQEKRKMFGSAAFYNGGEKKWTIYGGPLAVEENNKLTADRFDYWDDLGIFEAVGNVAAEMDVDKDYHDDIMEFYKERDGKEPGPDGRSKAAVFTGKIRYDEDNDILYAEERSTVRFRDLNIEADSVRVDYENDTATGAGKVIIKDPWTEIRADGFEIAGEDDRVEFRGNVRLKDIGRAATETSEKKDPFDLEADYLIYSKKTKKGTARGNVKIVSGEKDRSVSADKLEMDREKKVYVFTGKVRFHQDKGDWLMDRGVFDEDDDKAKKIAKKPTDVSCGKAVIDDGKNKFRFEGDVVVTQPEKTLKADNLDLDTSAKKLVANGNVQLSQSKGDWLFDEGFVEDDEDEEIKGKLRKPVQAKAEKLESLYGEKKLLLSGKVEIKQGKNRVSSDKIWYFGDRKQTILEGNVDIVDDKGRTAQAARVIYDREKKTFEAFKSIRGMSDIEME